MCTQTFANTSHAIVDTGTFICWPPRCVNTVALSAVCLVTSLRWQRGDRGERPRRGRLHRAERLRGDQRQSDGAPHHDQRLQDRLGLPGDRRHPLLPVRSAGQEGQGGGERYLSNYFCQHLLPSSMMREAGDHVLQQPPVSAYLCFRLFPIPPPLLVFFPYVLLSQPCFVHFHLLKVQCVTFKGTCFDEMGKNIFISKTEKWMDGWIYSMFEC